MRPRRLVTALLAATAALSVAALAPSAQAKASARYPYPLARKYVATAKTAMPSRGSKHWRLVYRTNFSHGLDTANSWDVYNGIASSNPLTQWMSPGHVVVSHKVLNIDGYVDRAVAPDGRVVTGGLGMWKRPQRYGKYEILARMQSCADVKYAWMLWPYSNRWPQDGEIDFAEDEGGNRQLTTASLNYAAPDGQRLVEPQDYATPVGGMSAWHVIGVEWSPTSVRYTMDGKYWGRTHTTHVPTTPMVLVMQTEGKALPGLVNLGGGSCDAQVAWVAQWAWRG